VLKDLDFGQIFPMSDEEFVGRLIQNMVDGGMLIEVESNEE